MKRIIQLILLAIAVFVVYQLSLKPPLEADWQPTVAIIPKAEFKGDLVTISNVRNFRYGPTESEVHPAYYDRTYNLDRIKQVWYITEPFKENTYAAHTFLSFEFENGHFLAITIEARKKVGQPYSMLKGLVRTYPLVYIAADERDVVLLRANLREDDVYAYPVKFASDDNARLLLESMLNKMNELAEKPEWYHALFANCTSMIAKHVNEISPGRISMLSWQLWFTASADELALKSGFIDTDLDLEAARAKYLITPKSLAIGDREGYSQLIRKP